MMPSLQVRRDTFLCCCDPTRFLFLSFPGVLTCAAQPKKKEEKKSCSPSRYRAVQLRPQEVIPPHHPTNQPTCVFLFSSSLHGLCCLDFVWAKRGDGGGGGDDGAPPSDQRLQSEAFSVENTSSRKHQCDYECLERLEFAMLWFNKSYLTRFETLNPRTPRFLLFPSLSF